MREENISNESSKREEEKEEVEGSNSIVDNNDEEDRDGGENVSNNNQVRSGDWFEISKYTINSGLSLAQQTSSVKYSFSMNFSINNIF